MTRLIMVKNKIILNLYFFLIINYLVNINVHDIKFFLSFDCLAGLVRIRNYIYFCIFYYHALKTNKSIMGFYSCANIKKL